MSSGDEKGAEKEYVPQRAYSTITWDDEELAELDVTEIDLETEEGRSDHPESRLSTSDSPRSTSVSPRSTSDSPRSPRNLHDIDRMHSFDTGEVQGVFSPLFYEPLLTCEPTNHLF